MKMTLTLLHAPYDVESIESFAFSEAANGAIHDHFERIWYGAVDLDPLIEEQTVRIDLDSTRAKIDYAFAEYVSPTKQEMDKYPPVWFFYVTAIERKHSSTVCDVHLRLDGLTTLMYAQQSAGKSINDLFTAQSYIRREHRNRFLAPSGNYSQYAIDKVKEGIPVDLKKIASRPLYSSSAVMSHIHWYIVYRARQSWTEDSSSGNAIDVYFCPADSLKVSSASSSGTGSMVTWGTIADCRFSSGGYYEIDSERSPGFLFALGGQYSATDYFMVIIHYTLSGNTMTFEKYAYRGSKGAITGVVVSTYTVTPPTATYASFHRLTSFKVLSSLTTDSDDIESASELQINAGTTTVSSVYSTKFADLDRTDPLLVKIVESPYPPAVLNRDANLNYSLADCVFDQATKMWKPTSRTEWYITLAYNSNTRIDFSKPTQRYVGSIAVDDEWEGFDPKLLHSDFYAIKVVYDTYCVSIELENEAIPTNRYTDITGRGLFVKWYISPDMNSLFAIEARMYYLANSSLASKTQDFGKFCVVDRNNERPIFTNAYLNYMRVGYNYDQKAKSLQNWSSIAGVAISAAGTIAGAATLNAPLTAASAAGLIASISSVAFGAASRENSMQSKLAQLKAQGTSVAGSSDVAILNLYCPHVHVIEYYPDQEVADSLARLFHRFGYATNQFKKPDIESRSLWNYIEGDVMVDAGQVVGIPPQVTERAIAQVKQGVTIFHATHDIYDLKQIYENWENEML